MNTTTNDYTTIILPENDKTFGLIKFNITNSAIAEMREKYMALKIDGINDKHGFNIVHEARMDVKSKRISVDKKTKELIAPADSYIDSVKDEQKRIKALLAPIEDYLDGEETRIEQERETLKREAAERENNRIQERINKVSAYGYAVDYSEIKNMTDLAFADLLEQAKEMHEKDLAAKAEAEQLFDEERKRVIAERKELDELRKQQMYEANIAKAEQVRIQKEQEARERAIKAEREKIDAEKKTVELQKQKENRTMLLAIETEALRPDKEKLQAFIQMLNEIKYPDVEDEEYKKIIAHSKKSIDFLIDDINVWANEWSVFLAEYQENDLITLVKEA